MEITIFYRLSPSASLLVHKKKQQHHIDDLSAKDSPVYADWAVSDCSMMSWLINSMDEKVSNGVMFLKTAKAIWDTFKETYSNE